MLKNVAIPLMLTASQAEGQVDTPGSADYWAKILKDRGEKGFGVKQIINASEGMDLPELTAPDSVCLGTADTAAAVSAELKKADTAYTTATKAVATAQTAVDTANKAITDLKAATGTWGKADKKVKDAQAKIVEALDPKTSTTAKAMDTKRLAYIAAVKKANDDAALMNTAIGLTTEKSLEAILKADGALAELHATAVTQAALYTDVKAKAVKAELYCMLGAMPKTQLTGAAIADGGVSDWWKLIPVPGAALVSTAQKCVVAGKNYSHKTLAAETATDLYDATYGKAQAIAARDSTSTKMKVSAANKDVWGQTTVLEADGTGTGMSQLAIVTYWRKWQQSMQWLKTSRDREAQFWTAVNASRTAALAEATGQSTDEKWNCGGTTAAAMQDVVQPRDCQSGAAARLKRYADAVAGENKKGGVWRNLPALKSAVGVISGTTTTPQGQFTMYGATDAGKTGMDTWDANNNDYADDTKNSLLYQSWKILREITAAMDAYYTKLGSTKTGANGTAAAAANEIQIDATNSSAVTVNAWNIESDWTRVGAVDDNCNVTTTFTTDTKRLKWGSKLTKSVADCKKQCWENSETALMQGHANFGTASPVVPLYGAARSAEFCYGYSYTHTNTECYLLSSENKAGDYKQSDAIDAGTIPVKNASSSSNECFYTKSMQVNGFPQLVAAVRAKYMAFETDYALAENNVNSKLLAGIGVQADLDQRWLDAWYEKNLWATIVTQLTDALSKTHLDKQNVTAGSEKTLEGWYTSITGKNFAGTAVAGNVDGTPTAATLKSKQEFAGDQLTAAQNTLKTELGKLTTLREKVDEMDRWATWLSFRIQAANVEIPLLAAAGTSRKALDKAVTDAKTNLDKYRAKALATDLTGKALDAYATWLKSATAVKTTQDEYQVAMDGLKLKGATAVTKYSALVKAVTDAELAFATEAAKLLPAGKEGKALVDAEAKLKTAKATQATELQACRSAAFTDYTKSLATALKTRGEDLDKIKKLIASNKALEKKPGEVGARCEKALSNGTFRPKRNVDGKDKPGSVCNSTEAAPLCCGAAKVPLKSGGDGGAAVGFRIIETCQAAKTTTYDYQPPRLPLATANPAPITGNKFACIQGAQKLVAVASAAATALYMLA